MSRGSLARALSMDCSAARSPCMTVMMISHSICPRARRNLMLVSAAATLLCAERRRREVDIGLLRSGGPIEGLGLASTMRGSSPAIRLMHVCSFANRVRVAVYAHTSAPQQSHASR